MFIMYSLSPVKTLNLPFCISCLFFYFLYENKSVTLYKFSYFSIIVLYILSQTYSYKKNAQYKLLHFSVGDF